MHRHNNDAKQESVYFVDSNKALSTTVKHGIIDKSLMLEHLHPTIKGYFVIANTFYQRLKSSKLLGEFPVNIPAKMAQNDLPIFDAEIYWGKAKIAAYQKKASWLTIANENLKRSQGKNSIIYLKSLKLLADAMPFNAQHNYRAGTELIRFRHFDQSLRYLKRAITHDPNNTNNRLALSHAYLEQKKLKQALPWLESVLALDPDNATANDVLPKVNAYLKQQ